MNVAFRHRLGPACTRKQDGSVDEEVAESRFFNLFHPSFECFLYGCFSGMVMVGESETDASMVIRSCWI